MNRPEKVSTSRAVARRLLRPTLSLLLLMALTAACGDGEASQGGSTGEPSMDTHEHHGVENGAAGNELPAALLGMAPPPRGESVSYDPGNPASAGYLALPSEGEGPFPAVILIHEWNGLVDRVRQVADALADEGYVALAADLFDGRTGSNPEENRALVTAARADPEAMIRNLDAAVAFLRDRDDVTGRIGAMGWCFGGGVALSFGLDGEHHEATAIFYGQLLDDPDILARLPHEVWGTFAREDRAPSPEQVERFREALDQAGIAHDLHIYDDVNHGFWLYVDQDPEVRAAPALDAWNRLRDYLARRLR
ncbi:MAG: dienelactone hydrolase family protein [Gemmatimonadales bacterium]|nr:MAG: dienelactone hydrolase family protein [Gemmatimonadales bacterium]